MGLPELREKLRELSRRIGWIDEHLEWNIRLEAWPGHEIDPATRQFLVLRPFQDPDKLDLPECALRRQQISCGRLGQLAFAEIDLSSGRRRIGEHDWLRAFAR